MSGIDHLVFAVADLGRARERHASLGFTMTPEARHPFGTGNTLVQLDGVFLEIVTVVDPALIPERTPETFSFAAFNRDFLRGGEGFSMLVMESKDAHADRERYRQADLRVYDPFDFSRKARLPGGEEVTVGFSLAFTSHPEIPNAGFFACQQRAPEHFWKAEYQRHANTAHTVLDVWLVTDRPLDFAEYLQVFAGAEDVTAADHRLDVETARGAIVAANAQEFGERFGVAPATAGREPCFGGYTIGVRDLGAARACMRKSGVEVSEHEGALVVAPDQMFGTAVAFRESA